MPLFDDIARQLSRAIRYVLLLSFGAGLISLFGAVVALSVLEGVLPSGDLELLQHVAALAVAVAASLAAIDVARRHILLRTEVWIEHALAGSAAAHDAARPAQVGELASFVGGPHMRALADAPFLFVPLAATAVLSVRLALAATLLVVTVLACAAGALVASHGPLRRLDDASAHAHGTRLGARYRAGARVATAIGIGWALALAGLTAVGALATAQVVRGSLSIGAAVVVTALVAAATFRAHRAIEAAPAAFAAALAWQRLKRTMVVHMQPLPAATLTADAVSSALARSKLDPEETASNGDRRGHPTSRPARSEGERPAPLVAPVPMPAALAAR